MPYGDFFWNAVHGFLEPNRVHRSIRVSIVRLDDLQDARTEPLPRLRCRRGSAELRDAEGISHVLLDGRWKAQEIALGGPDPNQKGLEKRMKDRTLVLRFLAFYQLTYTKAKKGLKQFFNEFIETYRNPTDPKLKEFAQAFRKAMRASYTIFGDKAFRLRRETKSGGEWTPNLNASVFQVLTVSFAEHDVGALTRTADSIFEAYVDLIATDEIWTDCVQRTTGEPSRIEYAFTTWNVRLRSIMKAAEDNDAARCFSRSLKEEIYAQDNICHMCGQKIVLVNDAAPDHVEQYWRGGRTVPENARLVHRTCNMKRSRQETGSV
jgi:hypothetical protein